MKPKKLKGKLVLNKETVAILEQEEQKRVAGGIMLTLHTILCCPHTMGLVCTITC